MVKRGGKTFYHLRPGVRVVCPKCGREGVVTIHRVRARGRVYEYLAVRHGKETIHHIPRDQVLALEDARELLRKRLEELEAEVEACRKLLSLLEEALSGGDR